MKKFAVISALAAILLTYTYVYIPVLRYLWKDLCPYGELRTLQINENGNMVDVYVKIDAEGPCSSIADIEAILRAVVWEWQTVEHEGIPKVCCSSGYHGGTYRTLVAFGHDQQAVRNRDCLSVTYYESL